MIRPLVPNDLDILNDWVWEWRNRRLPADYYEPDTDLFNGFMYGDAAAGWLISSRSIGFLDGFVSDPNALPTFRSECLDGLTQYLLELAKEHGLKRVFAITHIPAIIHRAHILGFQTVSEANTLLVKGV